VVKIAVPVPRRVVRVYRVGVVAGPLVIGAGPAVRAIGLAVGAALQGAALNDHRVRAGIPTRPGTRATTVTPPAVLHAPRLGQLHAQGRGAWGDGNV
jgi:hypothetical protein